MSLTGCPRGGPPAPALEVCADFPAETDSGLLSLRRGRCSEPPRGPPRPGAQAPAVGLGPQRQGHPAQAGPPGEPGSEALASCTPRPRGQRGVWHFGTGARPVSPLGNLTDSGPGTTAVRQRPDTPGAPLGPSRKGHPTCPSISPRPPPSPQSLARAQSPSCLRPSGRGRRSYSSSHRPLPAQSGAGHPRPRLGPSRVWCGPRAAGEGRGHCPSGRPPPSGPMTPQTRPPPPAHGGRAPTCECGGAFSPPQGRRPGVRNCPVSTELSDQDARTPVPTAPSSTPDWEGAGWGGGAAGLNESPCGSESPQGQLHLPGAELQGGCGHGNPASWRRYLW